VPERVGSYGDEATDLSRLAGRELDPEQALAVDAMLSFGRGGRWLALESAIVEARQNGKTAAVLLPVVLFDLFLLGADRIVWTAHLFKTARDAFADFDRLISSTPELSRRVKKVTYANGEESIELHSGARLEFLARSKGGGRGLGGRRLVMDEAGFLSAESMGALIPTLSAREDPQLNYGASAGLGSSDHLRALRDRGRKGGDPSLIWVEYCAPGGWDDPPCEQGRKCGHVVGTAGCALDDESLWPLANPAIGRRITYEYVRQERRALPAEEFGRERLGWFDLPEIEVRPIDMGEWAGRAIDPPDPNPPSPVYFLDASPGLGSASIGVAAVHNGKPHLDLAEYGGGADWLPVRAAKLRKDYPGAQFAVLGTGAVTALLPALKEQGIEPEVFTIPDMGRACGHLQKLVADKAVTHSGEPLFAQALSVAIKRDIGDDLWTWSRRKSGDISPLVAVTGAAWLLETQSVIPRSKVY
jgi:hypothetical protein